MLTVFLVIFILGFDFATPQDQIKTLIEKIGEKLEKQNEAILSDIREQLDLRMVLATDFKEQTKLTLAKLDAVYNDIENDSEVLGSVFREQINLAMEKIDANYQDMKDKKKDQLNKSMDKFDQIQLEIKSLHCSIYEKSYFDLESGSCFKYKMLTDKTRNRYDAQNECVAKSGALASVRSEEEWIFIKGILAKESRGVTSVWLGGSDEKDVNNFVWTDGSPVTYTDWYHGPNYSSQPDGGKCLYVYRGYNSQPNWKWWDDLCTHDNFYAVCKIPA